MTTTMTDYQPDLVVSTPPILHTRLLASESPRQAWYELSVIAVPPVGYLVRKVSGCQGRKGQSETWFRPDLASAQRKYQQLIHNKTRPDRPGRRYRQEELWPA